MKTDQAVATVHEIDSQMSQLEGKLTDAQQAEQALQQQYADLARNRDDWTLAEVGQMLSSASQQLELTGNTQLALFALQSADTRLAASDSAQAMAVRKAIAQDIDKLKSAPSTDLTGLAIKLDNAIDQVDSLPLNGEALIAHTVPHAADAGRYRAGGGGYRRAALEGVVAAVLGGHRPAIDEPRAGAPHRQRRRHADHARRGLLRARESEAAPAVGALALLSRNQTTLKSDLHAADAALERYFDNASKRTQTVRGLVKDVDDGSAAVEVPNLNTSLQAVNQYRSRG